jgi:thiamine biosynthesis protein ThiS
MRVLVNGREREAPEEATVLALLELVGVEPRRIAVEVNGRVVPARDLARVALRDRDRVEIVQFVGGG